MKRIQYKFKKPDFDFKGKIITVENEDEYNQLMDIFEKKSMIWADGRAPKKVLYNSNRSCTRIDTNSGRLGRGTLEFYTKKRSNYNNYTVIKFKDLFKQNINMDKSLENGE